jgi:hypothetical protein
MIYSVVWFPTAENQLAALWLNAPDRDVVRRSADALDAELQQDPFAIGESRDPDERVAFEYPLAISYWVDADRKRVVVHAVWRTDQPRP